MPSTIEMPTAVFVLIILLMLYIVFREDLPKKKPKMKIKKRPVNEQEFYNEQKIREQNQIPEYN